MSDEERDMSADPTLASKGLREAQGPNKPPASTSAPGAATRPPAKKAASAKKAGRKKAVEKRTVPKNAVRKKGKAAAVRKLRAVSRRIFPRFDLEGCYSLARAIREFNAGNPWSPKEIASALNMSTSSNFFYLTAACRDYGITIGTRDTAKIELTDLGRAIVYPKSPEQFAEAMTSAFRNVALFSKVYDYYQGKNLPDIQYLKNTLKTEFGVEEEFQDDFYDLFQRNLTYLKERTGQLPAAMRGVGKSFTSSGSGDSIILGESSNAGKLVAFVAMPFSERTSTFPPGYFDEVLKHLITPAAVKANFNARTANKAGSEVIQSTIVNDLDSADLVIVDLTEHNPNVLFELGMRIAFDKPVCLIRAKGTTPIFDIDHMLRVYDYNPAMWPSTLDVDIPALSTHIAETWKNRETDRSYLKILRDSKTA
jgi:hypothetical protein